MAIVISNKIWIISWQPVISTYVYKSVHVQSLNKEQELYTDIKCHADNNFYAQIIK